MTMPLVDRRGGGTGQIPEPLSGRDLWLSVTSLLITANLIMAAAMFVFGSPRADASYSVQLAWGANFGPATKDGEWWRLCTAMFLHFGPLHLGMNMLALLDSGRIVERIFGSVRFAVVYFSSGLTGNLLSLIVQGDRAVSGGASGAVFGVYGALLVALLLRRKQLHSGHFRWMFWGAAAFSTVSLLFGLITPGIDNAAHLGGLLAGMWVGYVFADSSVDMESHIHTRWIAGMAFVLTIAIFVAFVPAPRYPWSEELQARIEIREFIDEELRINSRLSALLAGKDVRGASFDQLAGRIETEVAHPYELSFEQLSSLHFNPNIPSAATVEKLRRYAEARRDASQELVGGLREKNPKRILQALEASRQAVQRGKDDSAERQQSLP